MSFAEWMKKQLEGCRPALQEVVPAVKESASAFWNCLRSDWVFFGICGLIVGLMRWLWPFIEQSQTALPQQIFFGLISAAVLGVFLFAALVFIGLSSLLPRGFLVDACDQAVLRTRQFASVMTAFLAGYSLIAIIQGILQGLPALQIVGNAALYVFIVPIFCILFTAPVHLRGRLCALLAWGLILAGLIGIGVSVLGV